jgi:hypothetical protein
MMYFIYSFPHQHVSVGIAAIFRVILTQEYKSTDIFSCFVVTLKQLKIRIFNCYGVNKIHHKQ